MKHARRFFHQFNFDSLFNSANGTLDYAILTLSEVVCCLPCCTDNHAIHTCTNTADLGFILYIFRINIKAFDNEF